MKNRLYSLIYKYLPLLFVTIYGLCGVFVVPSVFGSTDYLRLNRLAVEDGLSESYVNRLLIDRDGFLWLATQGGLNRYDGYQVVNIEGKEKSFDGNPIVHLYQDALGLMWISDGSKGVYTLDLATGEQKKIFSASMVSTLSEANQVDHIVEQNNGDLWLAATQTLRFYNRSDGTVEDVFSIKTLGREVDIIRRLLLYKQHLFIATSFGVFVMNVNTRQYRFIEHTGRVNPNENQLNTKELYLRDNQLWVGTVEGLFTVNIKNVQAFIEGKQSLPAGVERLQYRNIWRLMPMMGTFLLGTDDGLFSFDPANDSAERLWGFSDDPRYEITDNNIVDIAVDKDGNIWLASRTDGAFYWDPKSSAFESIHRKKFGVNQLSDNIVWSVAQTDPESLWVGTQNGLNKVDLATNNTTEYLVSDDKKAVATSGSIYKIMVANDGLLWLSTGDEKSPLSLFDPLSGQIKPIKVADEQTADVMAKVSLGHHLDEQSYLWFATDEHFYRYNTVTGQVAPLTGLDGVIKPVMLTGFLGALPERPNTMMVAIYGELWLYDLEKNQAKQIYSIPNFDLQDYLTPETWVVDRQNTLWLTISGYGLVGLDSKDFKVKYNYTNDKLPVTSIYGIQLDDRGNAWMSSHKGLLRLTIESKHVAQFTSKEGLVINEFNGGAGVNPSIALQDGRLAFASIMGVTLVNPSKLDSPRDKTFDVKFTGLSLLSRKIDMPYTDLSGTQLDLSFNDIGLKINFSTMTFNDQRSTQYKYRLTGSHELDYPQSTSNEILIPQLSPGAYEFTVHAIEPRTGRESPPRTISIVVDYAWYLSPQAYTTYGFLFFGVVGLWILRHQRAQRNLRAIHSHVVASEERLLLALRGSNSGVWDWQAKYNLMFEPRITGILDHTDLPKNLALIQHVELIHPNDRAEFETAWAMFLTRPEHNFECTYRMKSKNNGWFWFRDLGMVAEKDQFGKPSRITGTYTNITDTKANEEQARLFGEAFKQTRDWVLILDIYQTPIAANQSFRDTFGITASEELSHNPAKLIGIDRKKQSFYTEILHDLVAGEHWQGEEQVVNKEGQAYPVIMSINAVAGKIDEVAFYVMVLTDITAQKAAENDLRQLANYDSLTGLPNRALLLDRIRHAIEHARRYLFKMAVFFIDLDRFKQVNDSLGHDVGDLLLIDVAKRLQGVLREGDTVARLGGDEFVILLESYRTIEDVSHIAQKIIDSIGQPIRLGKDTVSVSPSIGIALYPEDAEHHHELLKHADVAMYHAKEAGRGNYQFFTMEMNQKARAKLELESKLKQAYSNDEFVNYYQPIVDASTNSIRGFELLMRWQSPEGLIPPYQFIPLAEDIGLIIKMTQSAVKRGLIDLRRWFDKGHEPYLSINLSVKDLEQDSLAEDLSMLIQASGLPPSLIRFEITESALMVDIAKAIETMNRLTELGTILALDDFGTGYSSLKYLKEFPIDIIKIDRSFVKDIGIDRNDEAIIDSIIVMASSLGMYCIAEGVETKEQLAFLTHRKCDLIQGYLYSKPVPADEVEALLNKTFDI